MTGDNQVEKKGADYEIFERNASTGAISSGTNFLCEKVICIVFLLHWIGNSTELFSCFCSENFVINSLNGFLF